MSKLKNSLKELGVFMFLKRKLINSVTKVVAFEKEKA